MLGYSAKKEHVAFPHTLTISRPSQMVTLINEQTISKLQSVIMLVPNYKSGRFIWVNVKSHN